MNNKVLCMLKERQLNCMKIGKKMGKTNQFQIKCKSVRVLLHRNVKNKQTRTNNFEESSAAVFNHQLLINT